MSRKIKLTKMFDLPTITWNEQYVLPFYAEGRYEIVGGGKHLSWWRIHDGRLQWKHQWTDQWTRWGEDSDGKVVDSEHKEEILLLDMIAEYFTNSILAGDNYKEAKHAG